MKNIIKFKWPITIGMIALTVLLFVLAPNLTKQAEEAGTFQLPKDAGSQRAAEILEDAGAGDETISLVYALDGKLDDAARKDIQADVDQLKDLGDPVKSILDPFESKDTESQLVSEDGRPFCSHHRRWLPGRSRRSRRFHSIGYHRWEERCLPDRGGIDQ